MSMKALGRPCRSPGLTVPVVNPPRPSAAGTYRSPERAPRDHSAREARRVERKGWAARKRFDRDVDGRTVLWHESMKTGPTPKRDTIRQDRFGAR